MSISQQDIQNPLRQLGFGDDAILQNGGFGAVLARSGVGKTSFIVQLSLFSMLQNNKVLHISLMDSVNKISLLYREIFNRITESYNAEEKDQLFESIAHKRLIMTFRAAGFNVDVFTERLAELTEQNIFSPKMLIIDGLEFEESNREMLSELKQLALNHSLCVWFTVRTHRHEEPYENDIPSQLSDVSDMFDALIQLKPDGTKIHVGALKGTTANSHASLCLDPVTMLMTAD